MSNQPVKKIIVVGGGTAGWMAASSFANTLSNTVDVTLIESDQISTVGVGEATVPPLILFNQYLGISEQAFLTQVRGSIKLGISFENWREKGHKYFHSFGYMGRSAWCASFQHFWRRGLDIGIDDPISAYSLETQLALSNKFSRMKEGEIGYAYHLDAGLYAKLLRGVAERAGAKRVEGKIVDVNINNQTGYIESIVLASGQVIEGDLFIDCSGFGALLIEGAMRTGYEDWSHWLPCDSAIAVQTESVREPVPYTRSIAHDAGWQWQIPLQHRVGNGLVYCSRYIGDEGAKKTLLDNIQGRLINEPKFIKYKTGQRLKYWNKNCVALGLASGFIEPLESTSIHLVQRGITRLIQMFPYNGVKEVDIREYNTQMKQEVLNVRDFIILHYHVTNRCDTQFWRSLKHMEIPDSLAHRIQLFRETGKVFIGANELFVEESWVQVMLGQGLLPETYHPAVNQMTSQELKAFLNSVKNPIKNILLQMPSHQEYINYYCKVNL